MRRAVDLWRQLSPEQHLAGLASLGLFLTMFLPWYQQNAVVSARSGEPLVSRNLNAFAVFSFVEAAILLVAAAVMFLLFARAERRSFRLPGSDGTIVALAGGWAGLLLVWRLFDKPGISSHGVAANVGVQWGIFFALAAAGLLAYAGSRMRLARTPEPPLMRSDPRQPATSARAARAPRPQSVRQGAQPPGEGAGRAARPRYPPPPGVTSPSTAGARALRSQRATAPAELEQLSFEDEPTREEPPTPAS